MSRRGAWLYPIAVMGITMIAGAPAAVAGTAVGCPAGKVASSAFASANLGANANTCGSVSAGANSVTASIPIGAPGFSVEDWLGITLNLPGFSGQSASVLQFSNFQATQGSSINFNWIASFEEFSEGYAFALLDGQFTLLQEHYLVPTITTDVVAVPPTNTQLTIGTDGLHTLSFGVVEGCTSCLGFTPNTLDPAATFSDIILTDATATPEPATLSMLGLGLAGIIIGAARRKRR